MQNKVIEQKRTVFFFKIYGEELEVKAPLMRQVKEFQELVKKDADNEVDESIKFLERLGLPKDFGWDMEPAHLKTLIQTVCGQKKS